MPPPRRGLSFTEAEAAQLLQQAGSRQKVPPPSPLAYLIPPEKAERDHKFGVGEEAKRQADNLTFHSIKEKDRYRELKALFLTGAITALQRQVRFALLSPSGEVVEWYAADFVYLQNRRWVVEDVKGHRTRDYRRKKRWMLSEYGIHIKET